METPRKPQWLTQEESSPVSQQTIESIKASEKLVDALQLCLDDIRLHQEEKAPPSHEDQEKQIFLPKESLKYESKNPILLKKAPARYVLDVLKKIRRSDLDTILLSLSYTSVEQLFQFFHLWLQQSLEVELVCRCCCTLLRLHLHRCMSSTALRPLLREINSKLKSALKKERDHIGYNVAAMSFMKANIDAQRQMIQDNVFLAE